MLGEAEEEVCELCLPRPGERPGSGVRGGAHRDSRSTYVARSAESKMRRCVAPRRLGGSKSVPQFEGSVASSAASVLGWVVACTRVFSACGVPESAPALQSERERAVATKWTRTATGGGEQGGIGVRKGVVGMGVVRGERGRRARGGRAQNGRCAGRGNRAEEVGMLLSKDGLVGGVDGLVYPVLGQWTYQRYHSTQIEPRLKGTSFS